VKTQEFDFQERENAMGRSRRGKKNKQQQGFSGPVQRHVWGSMLPDAGLEGRNKRRFFNTLSRIMILSAGVAGAFLGMSVLGWTGALIGFLVAAALMFAFVVGGRYLR
jgi:hypothetical protein